MQNKFKVGDHVLHYEMSGCGVPVYKYGTITNIFNFDGVNEDNIDVMLKNGDVFRSSSKKLNLYRKDFKVGDTVQYRDGVRPHNYIGVITEIGDDEISVNTIDGVRTCLRIDDLVLLDEFKTIEIPMPKFKKDENCYTVLKDGKKIRAQISSTPLYSIEEKTYLYKIINGSNCAYVDRYTPEIELMKMGVLEEELFDVSNELINDLNEYGNNSFKLDCDTYNLIYFTNRSSKQDEFFYIWGGQLYIRNIENLRLTKKQLDLIYKLSNMQLNRLESI